MTDAEMCAELCAVNDQLSWPEAFVVVALIAAGVMVVRLFFGRDW